MGCCMPDLFTGKQRHQHTDEEVWKELYAAIGYNEENNEDDEIFPKEYIKMELLLNVQETGFELKEASIGFPEVNLDVGSMSVNDYVTFKNPIDQDMSASWSQCVVCVYTIILQSFSKKYSYTHSTLVLLKSIMILQQDKNM